MTPEVKKRVEDINNGVVPEGYKRVGKKIIPENWECYKLGDLYVERNERGNDSLQILTVSIHTGVSDGELEEDDLGKKVKRSEDKSVYKHVYSGDVVFNMMRAWQGAIGVAKNEGMVSPAYISAIPNEKIYPMFMNYLLRSKDIIGQINDLSYGVTDFRKRLYWKSFVKVSCQLPSFVEQKKIASILITQDKLISLQEQKVEFLKKLKKVYLEKMFPKKGSKFPEYRFKGFTDAWEQRKVGELTIESSEYTTLEAGFPLLTSSRNGLMYQNEYRGKQTTDSTETMFSIVPLGACTYRHMSDDDVFHLNVNRLEKGLVSREYPVFYASDDNNLDFIVQQINSSAEFRSFCAEQKKGGTRTRLYYKNLCEFQMLVPNTEEQEKIATFLLTLDRIITLHQRKLEAEKKKKKALMQLLLTGKVRFNNAQ